MKSGRGATVPILSRWHQSGEVDFEEETDSLGKVRGGNDIAGVSGCTEFLCVHTCLSSIARSLQFNGGRPRPLG